jgi:hypothetical protein
MSDISKLPKWAQERIRDLERQRIAAVEALDAFEAAHATGPVTVNQMVCDKNGGPSIRKVRFDAHWLVIEHAGVELNITLAADEIRLGYSQAGRVSVSAVYFQPTSFQQFKLKSKMEL